MLSPRFTLPDTKKTITPHNILKKNLNRKMTNRKNEIPKPQNPDSLADNFTAFDELVRVLRRECPWDRKQTNESIAHLLIEESYEMIDAVQKGDDKEFSKELGDLLLHVVMHAVMAEERGAFNLKDVIKRIHAKLVHRHPHVFGETAVEGERQVLQNWEDLKMKEGRKSVLEGVPAALPSLLRAQRVQHKAANAGFDWEDNSGPWQKVEEELKELKTELQSGNNEKAEQEFGDLLFSLVNAARFEKIVAEEALQKTNSKFVNRFKYIEEKAHLADKKLSEMTLAEMDKLWDEAKEKGI